MNILKRIGLKKETKKYAELYKALDELPQYIKEHTEQQYKYFEETTIKPLCTVIRINGNGSMGKAIRVINSCLEPIEPIQTTEELDFRAGMATGRIYEMEAAGILDERQKDLAITILNGKYEVMRKARITRFVI